MYSDLINYLIPPHTQQPGYNPSADPAYDHLCMEAGRVIKELDAQVSDLTAALRIANDRIVGDQRTLVALSERVRELTK